MKTLPYDKCPDFEIEVLTTSGMQDEGGDEIAEVALFERIPNILELLEKIEIGGSCGVNGPEGDQRKGKSPSEISVEIGVGVKANGKFVIVSAEANATVKVRAVWK